MFLFILFTPFLEGKPKCLHASQAKVENMENYFHYNIATEKMPIQAGAKDLSVHFLPHSLRLFLLWTEKEQTIIRRKWKSKWLSPRR